MSYALPAVLAAAGAQTWFTRGSVLAGGDLALPVAPGDTYRAAWNQFVSAQGGPSYDIVGLPYYEGLRAAEWLGIGDALFQRIWLTMLFASLALAVVFFMFALVPNPIAAGVAGMLSAFNAYRFVAPGESAPLIATILGGVLGGLIIRAGVRDARARTVVLLAVASLGAEFLLVNPAYLYLLFLWLALCIALTFALEGTTAGLRSLATIAKAAPLTILLSLWWLVPAAMTLLSSEFWDRFAATGVDAWVWTHQRASIENVLTLNTAWNWHDRTYYPYSGSYDRVILRILQYALPILAAFGILLTRRRVHRVAIALATVAAVLTVIAKGVHPPLAEFNRWLYDHAPGFWILREPSKTLAFLSLTLAALAGLGLSELVRPPNGRLGPRLIGGLALFAGALAFAYPVFTGAEFHHSRLTLGPTPVRLPSAWREAAAYLNSRSPEGKALVLPRSAPYQVATTWGYWGAPFSNLLIHRGVFEANSGTYLPLSSSVSAAVAAIERDINEGDLGAVRTHLRLLGVKYILLRRDLQGGASPFGQFERPAGLGLALQRVPSLRLIRRWRLLDLYGVRRTTGDEVFSAFPVAYRGPADWIPDALELEPSSALVRLDHRTAPLLVLRNRLLRVFRVERGTWQLQGVFERGGFAVRLSNPLRFALADRNLGTLARRTMHFAGIHPPFVLSVGSAVFTVKSEQQGTLNFGDIPVSSNTRVAIWRPKQPRPIPFTRSSPLEDCNSNGSGASPQLLARVRGPALLSLSARSHAACIFLRIDPLDRFSPYSIAFSYRTLHGLPARACLWEEGSERCAPGLIAGKSSTQWRRSEYTVMPDVDATGLRLFFYADGDGVRRSVTEYLGVLVRRYQLLASRQVRLLPLAQIGTVEVNRSGYALVPRSRILEQPISLQNARPAGNCALTGNRTPAQLGISARVYEFRRRPVLRLAAGEQLGCVSFRVPFDPGASYRVRLSYRRARGNNPRVCLWQIGVERCAQLPPLEDSPGWHHLSATTTPEPGTVDLKLFLYADATFGGPTVTEFRDVSATPLSSLAMLGSPSTRSRPTVSYGRSGPAAFKAHVSHATSPFLLVVNETYAPDWRITGPSSAVPPHILVNGYANGWLIPWKGSYDLNISYGPERYASAARRIGLLLPAMLAVCALIARWLRQRLRHEAV